MSKDIGIIIVGAALFLGAAFYTYHIWSDCLAENSVFTCVRMLNK